MSKRSFVHKYFQTVAGENKVRCIECAITSTITTGTGSTSVMRNHMAFKHPQLYEKCSKTGIVQRNPKQNW